MNTDNLLKQARQLDIHQVAYYPIIKAAKSLNSHINNIVTYAKHRITNALGESLNSKIEKVKRLACGYRNRDHYKTAIYFHCGGLDLYPRRENVAFQVISP